jgi:hypothetical protein
MTKPKHSRLARQMPIPEEGIYKIHVKIDGHLLSTLEMPVLVKASGDVAH